MPKEKKEYYLWKLYICAELFLSFFSSSPAHSSSFIWTSNEYCIKDVDVEKEKNRIKPAKLITSIDDLESNIFLVMFNLKGKIGILSTQFNHTHIA